MKDIKLVLCPTDFSDASSDGINEAMELARQYGAKLEIVHVVELDAFVTMYGHSVALVEDAATHVKRIASEELEKFMKNLKSEGLNVESNVLVGNAAETICDHAKKGKADLIVMSTHGRSGFQRMLLGSVAEKVVRMAPCPVLTMKPKNQSGK